MKYKEMHHQMKEHYQEEAEDRVFDNFFYKI
jgi:hypothetical protein